MDDLDASEVLKYEFANLNDSGMKRQLILNENRIFFFNSLSSSKVSNELLFILKLFYAAAWKDKYAKFDLILSGT